MTVASNFQTHITQRWEEPNGLNAFDEAADHFPKVCPAVWDELPAAIFKCEDDTYLVVHADGNGIKAITKATAICAAHAAGIPTSKLAPLFGISPSSAYNVLKRNNVSMRSNGGARLIV